MVWLHACEFAMLLILWAAAACMPIPGLIILIAGSQHALLLLRAGSGAAREPVAMRTAVGNLRRLHAYAQGIAADAQQRGVLVVTAEDLRLLEGLADSLEGIMQLG